MTELIPVMIEKVNKIYSHYNDDNIDTEKELRKLLTWLLNDRSLQQHKMFFKYITFLYQSYGDGYSSLDNFRDELMRVIGYCDIIKRDGMLQDGTKFKVIKYKPHSISFGKCSQKKFNEIFNKIKELALNKWGVVFKEWEQEYKQNEHLL